MYIKVQCYETSLAKTGSLRPKSVNLATMDYVIALLYPTSGLVAMVSFVKSVGVLTDTPAKV